jgi:hypothetical protein
LSTLPRASRSTENYTSSNNLMLRQILTAAIFLGTTHGFGPLPEADRSLTASDRSLTASDRSLTDSDRSLTASARSWTPRPERPAGAEAEAIQRDSFEYPPVSKFVAPSDFWLNFVAPVSARPASACFLPAFKHSRAPLLLFHPQ